MLSCCSSWWLEEEFNAKLCRWEGRHVGDHDLLSVLHMTKVKSASGAKSAQAIQDV